MSEISSAAGLAQAYDVAMLGKMKDQAELQGKATLTMIESASVPLPPEGTGTLIDDVA